MSRKWIQLYAGCLNVCGDCCYDVLYCVEFQVPKCFMCQKYYRSRTRFSCNLQWVLLTSIFDTRYSQHHEVGENTRLYHISGRVREPSGQSSWKKQPLQLYVNSATTVCLPDPLWLIVGTSHFNSIKSGQWDCPRTGNQKTLWWPTIVRRLSCSLGRRFFHAKGARSEELILCLSSCSRWTP